MNCGTCGRPWCPLHIDPLREDVWCECKHHLKFHTLRSSKNWLRPTTDAKEIYCEGLKLDGSGEHCPCKKYIPDP